MYAVFITFCHHIYSLSPAIHFGKRKGRLLWNVLSFVNLSSSRYCFPPDFSADRPEILSRSLFPADFTLSFNAFFVFSASSFFFFSAASASCFARAALAFSILLLTEAGISNSSRYNRFPLHTYNRARSPPEWCRRYTPHWWTRHHRSRPP